MSTYELATFDSLLEDTPHTFAPYPDAIANSFVSLINNNLMIQELTLPNISHKQPFESAPPPSSNTTKYPIHESIRQKLDAFYETQKIPHIIFHGASGTGKITLVQEFIHKIYNGDKHRIKQNVMTVNCSHGKGIKFIREELKFFAKTNIQTNSGVLFKTIVLINAHHLTIDAQSALRRCIELFSYNTRFFIILENKHKLLKPILSRFCEIYVPEYTDSSENIINLHEHSLKEKYGISLQQSQFQEYINTKLKDILKWKRTVFKSSPPSLHILTDMAEDFYKMGISAMDIIEWVNSGDNKTAFSKTEHCSIMMCFYRVKSEFRCEKMLMFYLLHFMFCSEYVLPTL
jgi:hypothetical protein